MLRSLDSRLKHAIRDAQFSEELCDELEKLHSQSEQAAQATLDRLFTATNKGGALADIVRDMSAMAVLVQYLHRASHFMSASALHAWHPLLLSLLPTPPPHLVAPLSDLIEHLIIGQNELASALLELDSAVPALPVIRSPLLAFARQNTSDCFNLLAAAVKGAQGEEKQMWALALVASIVEAECPNLHIVPRTPTWAALLEVALDAKPEPKCLAVSCLLLLLPYVLREFCHSNLLSVLVKVFTSLLPVPPDFPPYHLYLIRVLYGLFPHGFVSQLRREMREDKALESTVTPLLSSLSFNPLTLTLDAQAELSEDRWQGGPTSLAHLLSPPPDNSLDLDVALCMLLDRHRELEAGVYPGMPVSPRERLLANRVVVERVLQRQESQRQIAELRTQQELRQARAMLLDRDHDAREAKRMHAHLLQQLVAQHRHCVELKETNANLRAHVDKSTQLFVMRERDLKERANSLNQALEAAQAELVAVARERDAEAARVMALTAQVSSSANTAPKSADDTRVWIAQRQEAQKLQSRLNELESHAHILEQMLENESEAQSANRHECAELQEALEEAHGSLQTAQAERDREREAVAELRNLLEKQQRSSRTREAAVRAQFESAQRIAAALEARLLEDRARNEQEDERKRREALEAQ